MTPVRDEDAGGGSPPSRACEQPRVAGADVPLLGDEQRAAEADAGAEREQRVEEARILRAARALHAVRRECAEERGVRGEHRATLRAQRRHEPRRCDSCGSRPASRSGRRSAPRGDREGARGRAPRRRRRTPSRRARGAACPSAGRRRCGGGTCRLRPARAARSRPTSRDPAVRRARSTCRRARSCRGRACARASGPDPRRRA